MNFDNRTLTENSIFLLKKLVETESFSKMEDKAADIIESYFKSMQIFPCRVGNNLIVKNLHFDDGKETILLNSHIDTVKPNNGYTRNPFEAVIKDGKLYGLGSNDAGGALVALCHAFLKFYDVPHMNYNLAFIASAEEEISGGGGLSEALKSIDFDVDYAIVGEPTRMNMAIAEKGLLVLDCIAHGEAAHAAYDLGTNAIYKAVKDIEFIQNYKFEKVSPLLGPVKMTVTIINAGTQHNVIPDKCQFVVDIRINELYTHAEILSFLRDNLASEIMPRSMKFKSSSIPEDNFLVQSGIKMGLETYGSPTCSDQIHLSCPSLKMGPGDSHRSHIADEFIYLNEIEKAIDIYTELLGNVLE